MITSTGILSASSPLLKAAAPSKHALAEADQNLSTALAPIFTDEVASSLTAPVTIAAATANVLNANAPWIYQAADVTAFNGTDAVVLAPTNNGARSPNVSFPMQVCFDFDGQAFEMKYVQNGGPGSTCRIWANEIPSAYHNMAAGAATMFLKVDFGSRAQRRVMIEADYGLFFVGLVRAATDSIMAPARYAPLKAAVVGDSYDLGQGVNSFNVSAQSYAAVLMRALGITQWRMYGQGGTGFLNPHTNIGTYRQRIGDVLSYQPDVCIIQGSINDAGFTTAAMQAEVATYITALRGGLPSSSLIIGVTPFPVNNNDRTNNATNAAGCLAAFQAASIPYVDAYTAQWLYGTGNVGVPTGDGNADFYQSSIAAGHPSQAGHDYIGRQFAAALTPILAGLLPDAL